MSPYLLLGGALAAALACGAAGFGGYRLGSSVKQGEWDASIVASREAQDKALKAAAAEIAKIDVKQQTIVQKVQHEVQTKEIYRDCVVPASGVGMLNDAINGAESADRGGVSSEAPAGK